MITGISNYPWMKFSLRSRTRSRSARLRVEVSLERVEAWGDRFGGRKFAAMASVVFSPLPVMQTTVVSTSLMRFCTMSFCVTPA